MPNLTNHVIFVTGANRGQGRAIVQYLYENGATVAVSARNLHDAEKVTSELGTRNTFAVQLDVTSEESWLAATEKVIAAYGRIDALVNNAGLLKRATFMDTTTSQVNEMMKVNFMGVFHGMQAVIPHMKHQQKGSIINNVSVSSFAPIPHSSAYASTKAAVVAMSKAAATELGPLGIRVNMIHPGAIDTDMAKVTTSTSDSYEDVPLGRMGTPTEIAKAVAFLASDDSSYCTGTELVVDGGMTLH
ncbi:SDR family NAD(P)-dependent oxidoreductase [Geomicrobium sp. JSM 1781026]|uniref:SDR family NAD(P)-dependent oxidoreductase n=1 Tax=Geomicrobium sp. JSM 1781026 TaxID=3344580 RepID=UPI0035C00E20